jgi:hypothetical protein
MLRDTKHARDRVPTLPTMTSWPSAVNASGSSKEGRSADRAATPGRNTPAGSSNTSAPRQARATDKLSTAPLATKDKRVNPMAASEAPTDTRRTRVWILITPIAAVLAAMVAGWWLYSSKDHDQALAREIAMAAMAQQAATRTTTELREATQQQREVADAVGRNLAAARREIETQAAMVRTVSGETAQLREDAKRATEELRQSEQQERERVDALERDLAAVRREVVAQAAGWSKVVDDATRLQQASERATTALWHAQQQQHENAEKLAGELATARSDLKAQAAALSRAGDETAWNRQQLTELRHGLQQVEAGAAAYREQLAQERVRNQELEQQLLARRDGPAGSNRDATAIPPDTSGPTHAKATDKPAFNAVATSDNVQMPTADKQMLMTTQASATVAPDPELLRLMSRSRMLISQGDIGAARIVLAHAAERGSAQALFALAETFDPLVLSTWRTFGTQSDVAGAQELYGKALTGGVQEAKERSEALNR